MFNSVAALSGTVIFFQNNLAEIGGALDSKGSSLILNAKHLCFTGNRAEAQHGGPSPLQRKKSGHVFYHSSDEEAYQGGALSLVHSRVSISGIVIMEEHYTVKIQQ